MRFLRFHVRAVVVFLMIAHLSFAASIAGADEKAHDGAYGEPYNGPYNGPYNPFGNYRAALSYLFDKENQWVLGAGLGSLVLARYYDDDIRMHYAHQKRLGGAEVFFDEFLGTGIPGALLGLGFWIYGESTSRSYEVKAGQAQLEALFATGALTALLKGGVGRMRPDGGQYSFPSGHTSTVTASATVLWEFYGWRVGVPAMTLAVLTGLSRVSSNRHWASDIVGGITLGAWVGHAVSQAHLKKNIENTTVLRFMPFIDSNGATLTLVRYF